MKVMILAGLVSAAMASVASASTMTIGPTPLACQSGEQRRARTPAPHPAPVAVAAGERADPGARPAPRRREAKRIPDAELIGPRGAL